MLACSSDLAFIYVHPLIVSDVDGVFSHSDSMYPREIRELGPMFLLSKPDTTGDFTHSCSFYIFLFLFCKDNILWHIEPLYILYDCHPSIKCITVQDYVTCVYNGKELLYENVCICNLK